MKHQHQSEELNALRRQGHRLTPQRVQVLRVVSSATHYLTAEEIHAAILPQQPSLDIATVYRTLQWLQGVGLVAPLDAGDGKLRFEYHHAGNQHHHLVCQQCGTATKVPATLTLAFKAEIAQQYGFVVDEHLVLPGRCTTCR